MFLFKEVSRWSAMVSTFTNRIKGNQKRAWENKIWIPPSILFFPSSFSCKLQPINRSVIERRDSVIDEETDVVLYMQFYTYFTFWYFLFLCFYFKYFRFQMVWEKNYISKYIQQSELSQLNPFLKFPYLLHCNPNRT